MKIHHLNCGTMCPVGGRLLLGTSRRLVCHCLLVESNEGLVLVDAGLGMQDVANPTRLGHLFNAVVRPKLLPEETAVAQVQRLGFKPSDVRHVIVTHLDPDHAGGIADFPQAQVHLLASELEVADNPRTRVERGRYRAALWAHGPRWVKHYVGGGEPWFGFERVRQPEGLPPEILMIPLPGHSRGQTGVAVQSGSRWLLHCGDAYIHHDEVRIEGFELPPGLRLHERATCDDHALMKRNIARLRALAREHAGEVSLFCAHDARELDLTRAQ